MSKDNDKPKIEEGELMQGPSLVAQFKDETRQSWAIKADEEFGPFLIICFDQEGGAHFKQMRAKVTTWMLGTILKYLEIIFDLEAGANLMAQKQAQKRGGILQVGTKLPPDFDAKAMGG